ncbi:hypothetical protein D3C87_1550480 [compost metagenome]
MQNRPVFVFKNFEYRHKLVNGIYITKANIELKRADVSNYKVDLINKTDFSKSISLAKIYSNFDKGVIEGTVLPLVININAEDYDNLNVNGDTTIAGYLLRFTFSDILHNEYYQDLLFPDLLDPIVMPPVSEQLMAKLK